MQKLVAGRKQKVTWRSPSRRKATIVLCLLLSFAAVSMAVAYQRAPRGDRRLNTGPQSQKSGEGKDPAMTAESLTSPSKEYIYAGGRLVATEEPGSSVGPSSTNVAFNKSATQSSTLAGGNAGRAVDGSSDGNWANNSVTHTNLETQPWWQVDLGSVQSVSWIQVWNRTDCCGDRLTNFYILVSDQPFASTDLATTLSQPGVSSYYTGAPPGNPITITAHRTARYVRVQLAGSNYLSLAEVQVWH
jgi:F5/8 type C domain